MATWTTLKKLTGRLLSYSLRFFSAKTIDEVFASLQKEESSSKFAQETLKLLRANSPLSLRVIWEQIKRGKDQDIRDSFIADFRTTQK